jgi:hypothetical protein
VEILDKIGVAFLDLQKATGYRHTAQMHTDEAGKMMRFHKGCRADDTNQQSKLDSWLNLGNH